MIWEYELDEPQFLCKLYDRQSVSDVTGLDCSESEDMAKQEFKDETDINTLVRRYHLTGELPEGVRKPEYGDFTSVASYHEAANMIAQANEAFMAMPAEIRARFGNDPGAFVEFCEKPENLEEARRMGLVPEVELRAREEAEAAPVAPVSPPGGDGGTLST